MREMFPVAYSQLPLSNCIRRHSATVMMILSPAACLAQWAPQTSRISAELRGLSPVDSKVVWASGARGTVLRTVDAGAHWQVDTVPDATSLDLRAIRGLSSRSAVAMAAGNAEQGQARIFLTSDAGAHWTLQFSTDVRGVFFDALAFWDATHGIAVSDPVDGRFYIITTEDGGHSWTRVPPEQLPPTLPGEAAFAASGTCLTVQGTRNVWIATGGGAEARVFHSGDGGKSWTVASTPARAGNASSGLFSVAFRDARHGIAVGGDYRQPTKALDNVVLTSDGGSTWTASPGPVPAGYMSAVTFVPGTSGEAVAVGLAGTAISTNDGRSWRMVDTTAYNSVAFSARDAGWTVGPGGRIARWR